MAPQGIDDEGSTVAPASPAGPASFPLPASSGAGATATGSGAGASAGSGGLVATGDGATHDGGPADEDPAPAPPLKVPHTRTSATYIGVAVGLLLLVIIIIFIAQNLSKASVHFLSFHFKLPEGLIVLAAAVGGGLIVLFVSLARVLQLRLMARRHRRAHTDT